MTGKIKMKPPTPKNIEQVWLGSVILGLARLGFSINNVAQVRMIVYKTTLLVINGLSSSSGAQLCGRDGRNPPTEGGARLRQLGHVSGHLSNCNSLQQVAINCSEGL